MTSEPRDPDQLPEYYAGYHPLSEEEAAELVEVDDVEVAPDAKLSYVASVRLNAQELDAFSEAARRAGLRLSTYIKSAAWQWTHLEAERRRAYLVRDEESRPRRGVRDEE